MPRQCVIEADCQHFLTGLPSFPTALIRPSAPLTLRGVCGAGRSPVDSSGAWPETDMLRSECEPFFIAPLPPPPAGIPQLVGYVKKDTGASEAIWWEWWYFHNAMHSVDIANWLADTGRGVLAKLVGSWGLGQTDISSPRRGQQPELIPRLAISTKGATALLLHSAHARSNSSERRRKMFRMARSWLQLAREELVAASESGVNFEADLPGADALVAACPIIGTIWAQKAAVLGGMCSDPTSPDATELLLVLAALPASVLMSCPWLKDVRFSVLLLIAFALERYVIQQYLPTYGRLVLLAPLRGKLRARHCDPIRREVVGSRMHNLGGSSALISRAVTGTNWHAQSWRHATVLLYDEKCHDTMRVHTQVSASMDPGSYSGESTAVGVIWTAESQKTVLLPTKVRRSETNE